MITKMPEHLLSLVDQSENAFASFDSDNWKVPLGGGKWTRLQVLGHLIDSAANNHQRFVRALAQTRLDWPGYDQVAHVSVQDYISANPAVCVALWAAYNRHISRVIGLITPEKASTPCSIDGAPDMALSDLALDYVAHLEHHLKQLLEGREITYSSLPWPLADQNRRWPV